MIEYLITENFSSWKLLLCYLLYTTILIWVYLHAYFRVDEIRIDLEYERKEEERLIKQEVESKYLDFMYAIRISTRFYSFWGEFNE